MTDEIAAGITSKQELDSNEPATNESPAVESDQLEKCPVCLQPIIEANASFASSCLHSFCLDCLIQWSRIKYSCPLCKQ